MTTATRLDPADLVVVFDEEVAATVRMYHRPAQVEAHFPFLDFGREYRCETCECMLMSTYRNPPLTIALKDGFTPFTVDERDSGVMMCLVCFVGNGAYTAILPATEWEASSSDGRHRLLPR